MNCKRIDTSMSPREKSLKNSFVAVHGAKDTSLDKNGSFCH